MHIILYREECAKYMIKNLQTPQRLMRECKHKKVYKMWCVEETILIKRILKSIFIKKLLFNDFYGLPHILVCVFVVDFSHSNGLLRPILVLSFCPIYFSWSLRFGHWWFPNVCAFSCFFSSFNHSSYERLLWMFRLYIYICSTFVDLSMQPQLAQIMRFMYMVFKLTITRCIWNVLAYYCSSFSFTRSSALC